MTTDMAILAKEYAWKFESRSDPMAPHVDSRWLYDCTSTVSTRTSEYTLRQIQGRDQSTPCQTTFCLVIDRYQVHNFYDHGR